MFGLGLFVPFGPFFPASEPEQLSVPKNGTVYDMLRRWPPLIESPVGNSLKTPRFSTHLSARHHHGSLTNAMPPACSTDRGDWGIDGMRRGDLWPGSVKRGASPCGRTELIDRRLLTEMQAGTAERRRGAERIVAADEWQSCWTRTLPLD